MNNEVWKPCPIFKECYLVSNFGRVKSLDRIITKVDGSRLPIKGKILEPTKNKEGYLKVILCNQGQSKTCYVHRLVAEAFIPNPKNFRTVNHKDFDTENNQVDNLEWCTLQQNIKHATKAGRGGRGGRIHCKLTEAEVLSIKRDLSAGVARKTLAKEYKVSYSTIKDIDKQSTWKDISLG